MTGIRSSARLALSIGIVGATVLWMCADYGIIPNPAQEALERRVQLAKLITVETSAAVKDNRLFGYDSIIERLVGSNDDLVSVGIVRTNGTYAYATPAHAENWQSTRFRDTSRLEANVFNQGRSWGKLQILFDPEHKLISSWWSYPLLPVLFVFGSLSITTWLMLSQSFRYLNPSKVVPSRVRSALDTLTEGLVLIDPNGEIVHSNNAFGQVVDQDTDGLIGKKLNQFTWQATENGYSAKPWEECLKGKESVRGRILELTVNEVSKKYIVNSSPVFGAGDSLKGALISLDDVTDLEKKKSELANMIETLRNSRDEVARQNKELHFLANCDPLTKCFNRRSFWNQATEYWRQCASGELNVIMVDIDHFKPINDRYGHSTGDDVLRDNGDLLRTIVGERGAVCRFGGEEFVILVPYVDLDTANSIAKEIHQAYGRVKLGGLSITASLGVSNTSLGAMDMQHLLDQADACLYAAKRNGRNQVVRFDQCDHQMSEIDAIETASSPTANIKHSTVTGLLSALAFKSPQTAEHSVRVADLCVAVGQKMIPKQNLYRLEVCGLLHDIGKIGVPDQILNKPGPLTDDEWIIMRKNDEIGESIIRSAFESDEMAEIVRLHKESFAARPDERILGLSLSAFPVESRIISACDAFDSMIGSHIYRPAQSLSTAIIELQRCTPDQFDPEVVDHLIQHVSQPGFLESRSVCLKTSTRSAVAISKHLEDLYQAVSSENLRELKSVVDNLKSDAQAGDIKIISEAATRLEAAMETDNAKLSQVMEIAEEVMQLCRSARNAIITNSDAEYPTENSAGHLV